jgi:hypothetical protein
MVWTCGAPNVLRPLRDRDRTADLPVTSDTWRTFGSVARKRLETIDVTDGDRLRAAVFDPASRLRWRQPSSAGIEDGRRH